MNTSQRTLVHFEWTVSTTTSVLSTVTILELDMDLTTIFYILPHPRGLPYEEVRHLIEYTLEQSHRIFVSKDSEAVFAVLFGRHTNRIISVDLDARQMQTVSDKMDALRKHVVRRLHL
ncbi:hypothetical protein [Heliothis virescens ascovirus 3j]|uniref:Uncharacterized protein n=2 Tax=unclassified Ascovirus TaxID=328613 RepID=A0A2Z5V702_9VIRU|nr:hypothetical protein [Heliothis virescens ascovirus 3h]BBB16639.1 hypothetical protein [Heliothis virescens ascovirus 3j]